MESSRGRGKILIKLPVRLPGQPVNSPPYILEMLALSESGKEVDSVVGQVAAVCLSPEGAEDFVNIVFNMSVYNQNFGLVAANVLAKLVLLDLKYAKNAIVNKLPAAFQERQRMHATYHIERTNFVYFLGRLFHLTATSTCKDFVCKPEQLITCLGWLLVPSWHNVELFAEQIIVNGHLLLHHCPESMAKIMVQARRLLMAQADMGSVEKMCISLCIDLEAHNFSSLPDHLLSLYSTSVPSNLTTLKKELSSLRNRGTHTGNRAKMCEEKGVFSVNKKLSNVNKHAKYCTV